MSNQNTLRYLLAFALATVSAVASLGLGFYALGLATGIEMEFLLAGKGLTPSITRSMLAVQTISIFLIPSLVFALAVPVKSLFFLQLHRPRGGAKIWLMAGLFALLVLPFNNFAAKANEIFIDALFGPDNWMKGMEIQAGMIVKTILQVSDTPSLIANICIVAMLPAIAEELAFRGVMLRLSERLMKNSHAAIFFSGLIFSLMHMQFYGFVPRFILGVAFGYMAVWSGSLFVPIVAHFTNNLIAVLIVYSISKGIIPESVEQIGGDGAGIIAGVVCGMAGIAFIFQMKKYINKDQDLLKAPL